MRNLRNIALAGATAVALTFGGTSVAVAAEAPAQGQNQSSQQDTNKGSSKGGASWQHKFGRALGIDPKDEKTYKVTGEDMWGVKKAEDLADSAKTLYGLTIALGVFAGLTALAAPIYNFFKFGPFAK